MSKKKEHSKLVPEFRFSEFENQGEWEEKELIDACDMQAGNFVKASEINEQNSDELFPCYGGNGLRGYTKSFTHNGSYPLIGRQGALCGNVAFATNKFHATEHAIAATPSKNIDTKWLFYLLVRANLNQYATGQAQPGLSVSNLKKIQISIPKNKKEQQKIANTLSTLDDLIGAETEKLEALKAHKKGLLQQLFPAKGEKMPKVRFGEFEGAWEVSTIEDIAKITTGNKDTQDKIEGGKYPFFVRSQTIEKINSFSFDGEAILTSGDGVGVGKIYHYIIGRFDYHQRVYCLYNFEEQISGKFVYYYFSEHFYSRVMKLSAKNSVDSVRRAMITEMPIYIPSFSEQQKIAACLSSLDDRIAAQSEKIAGLKEHKKGLMQQLFPSV